MATLKKGERLCELTLIRLLFSRGKAVYCGNGSAQIRVRYLYIDPNPDYPANTRYPCKVMVGASKKNFKHAVTRNRIKRLLREAYRAHKQEFEALVQRPQTLLLSLQYIGEPKIKLTVVDTLVKDLLSRVGRPALRK